MACFLIPNGTIIIIIVIRIFIIVIIINIIMITITIIIPYRCDMVHRGISW